MLDVTRNAPKDKNHGEPETGVGAVANAAVELTPACRPTTLFDCHSGEAVAVRTTSDIGKLPSQDGHLLSVDRDVLEEHSNRERERSGSRSSPTTGKMTTTAAAAAAAVVMFELGRADTDSPSPVLHPDLVLNTFNISAKDDELSLRTIPRNFIRSESVMIRVKPGQHFTPYASVIVESPAKCDPRLGTLGELKHILLTGNRKHVKRFLRQNNWTSGHRIRAELWKELCKDVNYDAQLMVYRETVAGFNKNVKAKPVSLTAPGVVLYDHLLNAAGHEALMCLLTVVEHVRPDFTYIPILYPLCAILLHYMSDEDAFACVMKILCSSQKFLIQTDIAVSAARRTLVVLLKKHSHKTFAFVKSLLNTTDDQLVIAVFNEWNAWLFRDLPYSHLVRVVDCFLFEGLKVLFRVTIAILMLWYRDKSKTFRFKAGGPLTPDSFGKELSLFCRSIRFSPQKLLKVAFNIRNLKMSHIRRIQEKHEMKLRRRESSLAEVASSQNLKNLLAMHNFIGIHFESEILDEQLAAQLVSWVPSRYHIIPPKKLFSVQQDGISFTTFWMKIENYCPSILLIKTSNDEVFGAYCSEAWSYRRRCANNCFFGTGECFLFRVTPEACHYPWIGLKKSPITHGEELFQLAQPSALIIGGGSSEGIAIRNTLEKGSTGRCNTFDNPPLCESGQFDIVALEVFGFPVEE